MKKNSTKIFALGGLNEIGKNTYCFEHEDEIIIVDAGVKFPEDEMLSINLIIPDYQYLEKNQDRIKAILVTHGHEDHVGGIPHLLKTVKVPLIVGSNLAIEIIKQKLLSVNCSMPKFRPLNSKTVWKSKHFTVDFFKVNHSIPQAYGMRIKTKNGVIVTTGDYKFDFSPIYETADLYKMSKIGEEGVDLLLSDSTNSLIPGTTPSEYFVKQQIHEIFLKVKGRLIVSTFASNIDRIKIIIEESVIFGRKIAVVGRSMEKLINIALELKIIKVDPSIFISVQKIKELRKDKIIILCTGSQGEPMAALGRISNNDHRNISIIAGDTIVLSSSPIPGNFRGVRNLINKLTRMGAIIIQKEKYAAIHSSGHGNQNDQKIMLSLIKPVHFMPMHGDYRMLLAHVETACTVCVRKENCFVLKNGEVIELFEKKVIKTDKTIKCNPVFISNENNFLKEQIVLERLDMGKNGLLSLFINIDAENNKLQKNPVFQHTGCSLDISDFNKNDLINDLKEKINNILVTKSNVRQLQTTIKKIVTNELSFYIKKMPLIVVLISRN